ncbi:unnamed protein product, partial [Symbiodinium pilosum]
APQMAPQQPPVAAGGKVIGGVVMPPPMASKKAVKAVKKSTTTAAPAQSGQPAKKEGGLKMLGVEMPRLPRLPVEIPVPDLPDLNFPHVPNPLDWLR